MRSGDHVRLSIDVFDAGQVDLAVLLACLAVDRAATLTRRQEASNRARFESFLRERCWLLEPMALPGIDLEQTRWSNVPVRGEPDPDFATLVYKVFRCSLGHGEELPAGFRFTRAVGTDRSQLLVAKGTLHLPDRLPFALLAAAILCPCNEGERTTDGYYFSLGDERFTVNEWWGREDDFRPIAGRYNHTRVKLDGLDRFE